MNEFKTICYDEITGDKAFKKGTIYTAKEYQKTIAITGEQDKKYAIELHFLKHTFLSHFIDLRFPTINDTIKYAISAGVLEIVGDEEPSSKYGCEGIRCRYNDVLFTNEFYFEGHDLLKTTGNNIFKSDYVSGSDYLSYIGINKVSTQIASTLEDMSNDEVDYIEANNYLTGIYEKILEKTGCKELAAPLDELIAKTVELDSKSEQER